MSQSKSIPQGVNFQQWLIEEARRTGKSEKQIVEETFHDGFMTYVVEEGVGAIDTSQLYVTGKQEDPLTECIRLRRTFGPVSAAVDYIRDAILGGGIAAIIDDPQNGTQKKIKEIVEDLIDEVYQDEYLRSLNVILPILIDDALTTGVAAAEEVYGKNFTFYDYATVKETGEKQKINDKVVKVINIETIEPNWEELINITRLKIFQNAYKRFKLYRDPKSWEAKYWSLDEVVGTEELVVNGIRISYMLPKKPAVSPIYFHPWQLFWLVLNRAGENAWSEIGSSIVMPVYSIAKLAEKIFGAIGEGIYRAGNKKYFIICGTADHPWGEPHIRNALQLLKEASTKNWSTIPMPAGFDIKDIGGTLFESNTVVEWFLKTIASTMEVPAKILGLEMRNDHYYDYKTLKNNLRFSIIHQLFKRQIWCKLGKSKTKQGGTTEPTFVPDVRFKTEELLSKADKLKMLVSMLNAANPVVPQVKLEIEKDLCRLMGWDNALLPSQEELQKILKEQEQAAKKPQPTGIPTEKTQGQPNPQTEERQLKRLQGGINKTLKGQTKPMGGTRLPKETVVQETEENSISYRIMSPISKSEININLTSPSKEIQETTPISEIPVKIDIHTSSDPIQTEPLRLEIETKSEPIKVQTETQRVQIDLKSEPIKVQTEPQKVQIDMKSEPQQIDVNVKNEPQKVQIEMKNEPQKVEVEVKNQPQKVEIELKQPEKENNLTDEKVKTEKSKQEVLAKVKKAAEKIGE